MTEPKEEVEVEERVEEYEDYYLVRNILIGIFVYVLIMFSIPYIFSKSKTDPSAPILEKFLFVHKDQDTKRFSFYTYDQAVGKEEPRFAASTWPKKIAASNHISVSNDGRQLACYFNFKREISIIKLRTGQELNTINGNASYVTFGLETDDVIFAHMQPDTTKSSVTVEMVNLKEGIKKKTFEASVFELQDPIYPQLAANNKRIIFGTRTVNADNSQSFSIRALNRTDPSVSTELVSGKGHLSSFLVSPNGMMIAYSTDGTDLFVVDQKDGAHIWKSKKSIRPNALKYMKDPTKNWMMWSPNNEYIYYLDPQENGLQSVKKIEIGLDNDPEIIVKDLDKNIISIWRFD